MGVWWRLPGGSEQPPCACGVYELTASLGVPGGHRSPTTNSLKSSGPCMNLTELSLDKGDSHQLCSIHTRCWCQCCVLSPLSPFIPVLGWATYTLTSWGSLILGRPHQSVWFLFCLFVLYAFSRIKMVLVWIVFSLKINSKGMYVSLKLYFWSWDGFHVLCQGS